VFGELFKIMTGADMVHIPYRGGYMPDLLGGRLQVVFASISSSLQSIRAGMVRALGVTTARRTEALPGVPALGEFVPGYDASVWYGIAAPRNTPAEIVERLNAAINEAAADPALKTKLAGLGVDPTAMSPAAFGQFIADETTKWAKVITSANIQPE
jgi:tripartite-type tricarboxylate transporter receptor subunit TctC